MEFDPGRPTLSYPRRPCKLDRSFSWTGTSKKDMLGDCPSQYSLTDLDYNSAYYDQSMDFVDIPSMFEDALRQLASNPYFAYPTEPLQTVSSAQASRTATIQNSRELEAGPSEFHTADDQDFWSASLMTDTAQDFSSWPALPNDDLVILGSPVGALDSTCNASGLQNSNADSVFQSSSIFSPIVSEARTRLDTIIEDTTSHPESTYTDYLHDSMMLNSYYPQTFPSISLGDTLAGDDYGPFHDDALPSQPLDKPLSSEAPVSFQDFATKESSLVLVKVDMKFFRDDQKPSNVPPPLNDLLSKFDSNPYSPIPKRSRSRYTEVGKTKVRQVRISGACAFCKVRKVPCTALGVCTACAKIASGNPVSNHICVRTKLRDTFVGVRALHGSSFDNRKARLAPFLSSLIGRPKPIQLSVETYDEHDSVPFRNNDHHIRTLASLNIQVMQCSASSLCRWKKLTKVSGIFITSDIFEGQRYVIVPSSLPSIDEFDKFGRKILLASDGGHSGTITLLLDQFLTIYCAREQNTKVCAIANTTSRIASLNNLVAYGFLNLRDGSYDLLFERPENNHSQRYVSETVHDQIRLLAAEGLEPAEKIVFHELDNINKHVCGSEHARMIIGICILRLMLLYRDRLVRDEIRLGLPRQKKWHQYRLEKASFMYRRLTVAYATLCREYDTPLTMEWEDKKIIELSGHDETLQTIYSQLQPAFRDFCDERLSLQYDDVLKILLANPKQQKAKKRRKISQ